jgi:hypothetical protein
MKSLLLLAACLLAAASATAQIQIPTPTTPASQDVSQSIFSPFSHLVDALPAPSMQKSMLIGPCPEYPFYNTSGSTVTHTRTLPSPVYAIRFTLPSLAISRCTVWTVNIDFDIIGPGSSTNDTMFITMREVNPPYTTIFTTYFVARLGLNKGPIEISPTLAPPSNQYAIINSKRDMYLTLQVRGPATHQSVMRFTTPSIYSSNPRSMIFSTPTSVVTASSVVGGNIDWTLTPALCCDIQVPVELSLFEGTSDGARVELRWRTEAETNNHGFTVERATTPDGPWSERGTIAGAGTTGSARDYAFTDALERDLLTEGSAPFVYYRLRQMDYDGTITYHGPIRVTAAEASAAGFRLYPNYPNPLLLSRTNGSAIRYELPTDNAVQITVHDALGREVARLVDDVRPAGVHEAVWYPAAGAEGVRSGQYFVRMQSGTYTDVQRLTVVK